MSDTDRVKIQRLRKAFATFKTGCSITQEDHLPPEACDECAAAFLEAVRSIVGETEPRHKQPAGDDYRRV